MAFKEAVDFEHVIYRSSDYDRPSVPLNHATCGATVFNATEAHRETERRRRAAFDPSRTACDVVRFLAHLASF